MLHETTRLILRPLVSTDAPWIAQDIAKPEVQRWLTSPPHPYTLADARAFIGQFADAHGIRVIVVDGAPSGVVSIERASAIAPGRPDRHELGYWLAPRAWGHGYMTEAARKMIAWHFGQSDAPVESGWIKGNAASENVLTKLGFRLTGETVRRRAHFLGRDVPVIRTALSGPAWRALENPAQTR